MALSGPIILVEDDQDDQAFGLMCLNSFKLQNIIRVFNNGTEALDYLNTTSENPFLILCDINMPKMTGLQLRRIINGDPDLKKKSIPFVFLTGSANPKDVTEAFDLTVQGFFVKEAELGNLKKKLRAIVDYWQLSQEPNRN
ncbi:MAG: histidine kinase [Bacteroidetes bacterium]|jgi:CheY-like chemotaxis protein|nr:histidine kinase [Bacteroidota bacterium]